MISILVWLLQLTCHCYVAGWFCFLFLCVCFFQSSGYQRGRPATLRILRAVVVVIIIHLVVVGGAEMVEEEGDGTRERTNMLKRERERVTMEEKEEMGV